MEMYVPDKSGCIVSVKKSKLVYPKRAFGDQASPDSEAGHSQDSHQVPRPHDRMSRKAKRQARRLVTQSYWAQEQAHEQVESEEVSFAQRMELLSRYGDFSIAYSTAVQPLLKYVGDASGYLAYRKRWGMSFALGDIVASEANQDRLLDDFLKSHRRVSFCQISRPLAQRLADRGFLINEMGVDTTLDLAEYTLAGRQKEWLRYASNWIAKRNYRIVESSFDEIKPSQVEFVSEAWRVTRTVKRKEVRFLNRPIVLQEEADVRKFFLLSESGELQAFVFLDPIYHNGTIIGYVTVFKRRLPAAPQYAEQAIMKHVIETLKNEGVPQLKLGLSPLAEIEDSEFQHNRFTRWAFQRVFETRWINRKFYNVVGHAEYKKRFRGKSEKVYFASPAKFNTPRMLALIGLCGIA
ncbi:MAG: lysylphosphatidylglycerol synthetase-like protein (DUF2156 family) [Mariniblastus sp.]|jgi:lysylphosphatidylglycerol synthetase-like protein (DUF2156 family)